MPHVHAEVAHSVLPLVLPLAAVGTRLAGRSPVEGVAEHPQSVDWSFHGIPFLPSRLQHGHPPSLRASFAKEQKDRGVLSDQAAGLWKPLAPHALRAGLRLQYPDTPVAGLLERIIRSRFEPHG